MKFYYSVDEKEEEPDLRHVYEDHWVYDEDKIWSVVNDVAYDHFRKHDGWEMWNETTKLEFYLWNENHEYLGKYKVMLETEPSFHSVKVEE